MIHETPGKLGPSEAGNSVFNGRGTTAACWGHPGECGNRKTEEKKVTIQDKLAKFNEKWFWCPKAWSCSPSPGTHQVSLDTSLHPVHPVVLPPRAALPRTALLGRLKPCKVHRVGCAGFSL